MAGHQLIDEHLSVLSRRLPPAAVDELTDGLLETWQGHLTAGLAPTPAARAAIAEFGTPQQITDAFVAQSPGRRNARTLLATGPLVGACWGAGLVAAHAWTWQVPTPAVVGVGLTLLTVVGALLLAATSRRSYRRTRLGTAGGIGLIVLDLATPTAVLLLAPALAWPMLAAVAASLVRTSLTLRSLRTALRG